jgi:hypothetical protein
MSLFAAAAVGVRRSHSERRDVALTTTDMNEMPRPLPSAIGFRGVQPALACERQTARNASAIL